VGQIWLRHVGFSLDWVTLGCVWLR